MKSGEEQNYGEGGAGESEGRENCEGKKKPLP